MKNLSVFSFISLLLFSCGTGKETVDNGSEDVATKKGILVDNYDNYGESAYTTISKATLDGNVLVLDISYSGGCEEHDFILIGFPDILKSEPPKRMIKLHHNSNGDSCRELKEETIRFNISDFGYSKGVEIKLMFEGYKEEISYTLQ